MATSSGQATGDPRFDRGWERERQYRRWQRERSRRYYDDDD